jgi:hypothetical protein
MLPNIDWVRDMDCLFSKTVTECILCIFLFIMQVISVTSHIPIWLPSILWRPCLRYRVWCCYLSPVFDPDRKKWNPEKQSRWKCHLPFDNTVTRARNRIIYLLNWKGILHLELLFKWHTIKMHYTKEKENEWFISKSLALFQAYRP